MNFVTKVDSSDNRQIKQYQNTTTQYSGTTIFGVDDSLIPINDIPNTINIDALQNIRTVGIILPETIPTFTGSSYQLLGRDTNTGKVVEVTDISGGTGGTGTTYVTGLQKEVSGDYTILSGDNDTLLYLSDVSDREITINSGFTDNFATEFINVGTANYTFLTGGTATLNYPDGLTLLPNRVAFLVKRNSNGEYWLKGELE